MMTLIMTTAFDSFALYLQFASCLFMAGVISVIQLIHYPSFKYIKREQFQEFHLQHTKALGLIAGPMMCIEFLTAFWLVKNGSILFLANAIAVVFLWCLTFFISVPAHNQLALGFNELVWRKLVRTNWFRTALWLIRAFLFNFIFIYSSR